MKTIVSEKRLRAMLEQMMLESLDQTPTRSAIQYVADPKDVNAVLASVYSGGTDFGQAFENIAIKALTAQGISVYDLNPQGTISVEDDDSEKTPAVNAELADLIISDNASFYKGSTPEQVESAILLSAKANKGPKGFNGSVEDFRKKLKKLIKNRLIADIHLSTSAQILKARVGTLNVALNPKASLEREKIIYDMLISYPNTPNVCISDINENYKKKFNAATVSNPDEFVNTALLTYIKTRPTVDSGKIDIESKLASLINYNNSLPDAFWSPSPATFTSKNSMPDELASPRIISFAGRSKDISNSIANTLKIIKCDQAYLGDQSTKILKTEREALMPRLRGIRSFNKMVADYADGIANNVVSWFNNFNDTLEALSVEYYNFLLRMDDKFRKLTYLPDEIKDLSTITHQHIMDYYESVIKSENQEYLQLVEAHENTLVAVDDAMARLESRTEEIKSAFEMVPETTIGQLIKQLRNIIAYKDSSLDIKKTREKLFRAYNMDAPKPLTVSDIKIGKRVPEAEKQQNIQNRELILSTAQRVCQDLINELESLQQALETANRAYVDAEEKRQFLYAYEFAGKIAEFAELNGLTVEDYRTQYGLFYHDQTLSKTGKFIQKDFLKEINTALGTNLQMNDELQITGINDLREKISKKYKDAFTITESGFPNILAKDFVKISLYKDYLDKLSKGANFVNPPARPSLGSGFFDPANDSQTQTYDTFLNDKVIKDVWLLDADGNPLRALSDSSSSYYTFHDKYISHLDNTQLYFQVDLDLQGAGLDQNVIDAISKEYKKENQGQAGNEFLLQRYAALKFVNMLNEGLIRTKSALTTRRESTPYPLTTLKKYEEPEKFTEGDLVSITAETNLKIAELTKELPETLVADSPLVRDFMKASQSILSIGKIVGEDPNLEDRATISMDDINLIVKLGQMIQKAEANKRNEGLIREDNITTPALNQFIKPSLSIREALLAIQEIAQFLIDAIKNNDKEKLDIFLQDDTATNITNTPVDLSDVDKDLRQDSPMQNVESGDLSQMKTALSNLEETRLYSSILKDIMEAVSKKSNLINNLDSLLQSEDESSFRQALMLASSLVQGNTNLEQAREVRNLVSKHYNRLVDEYNMLKLDIEDLVDQRKEYYEMTNVSTYGHQRSIAQGFSQATEGYVGMEKIDAELPPLREKLNALETLIQSVINDVFYE